MVQCVKLMLRIFEFGVLLFDCFVYCQYVACLKRFTTYGHYAGEVEDSHRQTCSCLLNRCVKNRAFSCGLLKSNWLRFFVDTLCIHSLQSVFYYRLNRAILLPYAMCMLRFVGKHYIIPVDHEAGSLP